MGISLLFFPLALKWQTPLSCRVGVPNSPWTVDGNTGQPSRADINFTPKLAIWWQVSKHKKHWQFGGKYESIKSSEWMNNGTLCKKRLYHSAFLMCRNSQETRVFSTCVNLAHPNPIFHSLASLRVCPIELLGLDWTGRRSPVSLQPPANQQ